MKSKIQNNEKVTRTACWVQCGAACGVLAHVEDGVLTKVEPADFPEPQWRHMCSKGLSTPKIVNHPDRLKFPMKRVGERGEGKWQRISWDEALDTIAGKLKGIAAKYGPESVAYPMGGITLPSGGVFSGQRFASASGGTFVSVLGSGDAAQPCADMLSYGNRWLETYLIDQVNPPLCVVWGSNMLETEIWKYRRIRDAREKGARVVVIDPRFTPTAAKADEYIPVRPGTDAALALGMINIIEKDKLCDDAFLIDHTVGPFLVRSDNGLYLREEQTSSKDTAGKYVIWDTKTNKPQPFDTPGVMPALRGSYTANGIKCKPAFQLLVDLARQYPLKKASEITGVAPDTIRKLAVEYATMKPVLTSKSWGAQRTFHGDLSHRAITALAAVTGNINLKRPEGDFFAALNWGPFMFPEGMMSKQMPILNFYDAVLKEKPYPVKAMWVSGHNPANSAADRNKFKEVMSKLEFIVVVELFMTATAEYADIVLPGSTSFESVNLALPYTFCWGWHPYLQLQPKVIEPLHESKSDLDIFTELARRMGLGELFNKSSEEYIEMLLSSGSPSLEGISLETLREGPKIVRPSPIPLFMTPSGKLEFYVEKMKEFGQELPVYLEPLESSRRPLAQKYPLSFISTHSKYRHHSTFANVDCLRETEPEPVLDMNPVDARKRDIRDGQMVLAFNDRGKVKVKARIHAGMKPGIVNITEGWWPKDFAEGSYQELTHNVINPAQQVAHEPNAAFFDVLVEVKKA